MSHYCPTCRDEHTGLGDGNSPPYAATHVQVNKALAHVNPVTREALWRVEPNPGTNPRGVW